MIIQDISVTRADGTKFVVRGVAQKQVIGITDSIAIMDLSGALAIGPNQKQPLAMFVLQPGMLIEYSNQTATTSQIDDESGMIKKKNEGDENPLRVSEE